MCIIYTIDCDFGDNGLDNQTSKLWVEHALATLSYVRKLVCIYLSVQAKYDRMLTYRTFRQYSVPSMGL